MRLAFVCLGGGAGLAAAGPESFTIRIHLTVDRPDQPRVVTRTVQEEAESLWQLYGVHLDWTGGPSSEPDPGGISMRVIIGQRIEGANQQRASVLGQAPVDVGTMPVRPIVVSIDATEHLLALQRMVSSNPRIVTSRELSRALGRVLAHEIGHVLLRAPYHDQAGLMRPGFRADDLGAPDRGSFLLSCNAVGRLRSRIQSITASMRIDPKVSGLVDDRVIDTAVGLFDAPCIPARRGR